MDKIIIRGLKIKTLIGIHPDERQQPTELVLNLEIPINIKRAAKTDNIKHTLNYAEITQDLHDLISKTQYYLLEALAEEILNFLKKKYHVKKIYLEILKQHIVPDTEQTGLILDRLK